MQNIYKHIIDGQKPRKLDIDSHYSTIERARGKEIEKETTVAARIQASPTILLLLFFFVL